MKTITKVLIFVGIIAAVTVVQFFMPNIGQTQHIRLEQTGHGVSYDFDASPSFHSNSSGDFFFATRDGIQFRSSSDTQHWHLAFTFNNPVMVGSGNIVAVGEPRGRRVYVFNSNGLLFPIDSEHPIMLFSVNSTGFLAVVVQYPNGHRIRVYNPNSFAEPLFTRAIVGQDEALWYPTAVEISDNGRYIAVALLDLNTLLRTTVEFGYINASDGFGTEDRFGIFASEILHGQIVSAMQFMADNKVVVATTSYIICFQLTQHVHAPTTISEVWRRELNSSIDHIAFYGNRYVVYITGDRHVGVTDAPPMGTINIVNVNNTVAGVFNLGRRATHLFVGHGALLVGADRNFHAISMRGVHLWEHNALFDTRGRQVIFLDNTDTILIGGANRAEVHERRRVQVDDFEFLD